VQSGNRGRVAAALEHPQQLAERLLAFAADDEVDFRAAGVRFGREARIVAADDDPRVRPQLADQPRQLQRRLPLKRHHRQADDVGLDLADEVGDGRTDRALHQNQIGDEHAMVRIDISSQRRQRAVRHANGDRRHVLERIRHREQQDVHRSASGFGEA
jgi:hypothetical protein